MIQGVLAYHVSEDNICQKKDITLHDICLQIDDRNKESLEFAGRFSSIIPKNVMFQKGSHLSALFRRTNWQFKKIPVLMQGMKNSCYKKIDSAFLISTVIISV